MSEIDRIIATARRDSRCISGIERRMLCDEIERLRKGHCEDCCCANAWKALGITNYTGRSIPEEIERLRAVKSSLTAECNRLEQDRDYNAGLVAEQQAEIERLRAALQDCITLASWHCDEDADPGDDSPEDAVAHVNGLIYQVARTALAAGGGDE